MISKNKNSVLITSPLFCWDVFAYESQLLRDRLKKQSEIRLLREISQRQGWAFEWNRLFQYNYQTIVLTGLDRNIIWVNEGFREMTGYPKGYAIGKSPRFLQGPETKESDKEQFRKSLSTGKVFKHRILNYRKDNSKYFCEITIIPLKDHFSGVTAYMALEREL